MGFPPTSASVLHWLLISVPVPAAAAPGDVVARRETRPVESSGDAADDLCVWLHPTDAAQSLIIGTDKDNGLEIYSLTGQRLQTLADGDMNNVDLRYDFLLGGARIDLVASTQRSLNTIALYRVAPDAARDFGRPFLENVAARDVFFLHEGYGCCLYRSPVTGKVFFFATTKEGIVEQYLLFDNGMGRVDGRLVRSFDVGGTCEGCIADDHYGTLFVSQEDDAIWSYGAEPGDRDTRILVDTVGPGGHLDSDVEGLSIYQTPDGAGYLLASSQGSDNFVVYDRRQPYAYVQTFQIVAGATIDGVTNTDGIDVVNVPFGATFPNGCFIAHDGENDLENSNFKLVDWPDIALLQNPALRVDTRWDPRSATRNPIRLYSIPKGRCVVNEFVTFHLDDGELPNQAPFFLRFGLELSADARHVENSFTIFADVTDNNGKWHSPSLSVPPELAGLTFFLQPVVQNGLGAFQFGLVYPVHVE